MFRTDPHHHPHGTAIATPRRRRGRERRVQDRRVLLEARPEGIERRVAERRGDADRRERPARPATVTARLPSTDNPAAGARVFVDEPPTAAAAVRGRAAHYARHAANDPRIGSRVDLHV